MLLFIFKEFLFDIRSKLKILRFLFCNLDNLEEIIVSNGKAPDQCNYRIFEFSTNGINSKEKKQEFHCLLAESMRLHKK